MSLPHSNASSPRILMVSSEAAPFARTGGLGDVLASLPKALVKLGAEVSVLIPAYRSVLHSSPDLRDTGLHFSIPFSGKNAEGHLLEAPRRSGVRVYLARADQYFDRDGYYDDAQGAYQDNTERFAFFSRAALQVLRLTAADVLHAHDWQAAMATVFLRTDAAALPELAGVKSVFTMHNVGYQGQSPLADWPCLALDWRYFTPRYLEFYRKINFLKGGAVFADALTTVSPTYAEEIKTPEYGNGLEGVFQERTSALAGILNGVDYDLWDPATDPLIASRYTVGDTSGKGGCKADLQRTFGLPERPDVPIIGMVSRLASQKGLDLIQEAIGELLSHDLQFIVLGSGEPRYEEFIRTLAVLSPDKAAGVIAFDDALAHKVEAGADLFLMPSRYEPCGLNQIYSLKYGTIPVVRATGGLKDTVREFDPKAGTGSGFLFEPYEAPAMLEAIDRALAVYRQKPAWARLVRTAMSADFSWDRSAVAYLELYQRLLGRAGPT